MTDPDSRASGDVPAATTNSGKQKVGHTTLDANNEPQKFKKLELENLQRSIQHGMLSVIANKKLYEPERQMLMADLEQVVMLNIQGSEVPRNLKFTSDKPLSSSMSDTHDASAIEPSPSSSTQQVSVANYRFKAYAPRAFDFFRQIYKVDKGEFMNSIGAPMKCIPNTGASGSLFFITGDDCFIMKTLQKKEAVFLLELYPGYILNLYQSPDTLLPKYFGCYCYQSILGKNVRVAIMNNLIPRNVTLWKKYDLKGSTYKRVTDESKSSSKVPTLKDLNFINDFKNLGRIVLEPDVYKALINRLENDTLMLESFQIMDYSFLMAIEKVDAEKLRTATLRPEKDKVPTFYQYSQILNLPVLGHQKGIPAKTENGEELRLYVGIIDILQKYVLKKKLEHRVKAVFLESQDSEVSVTHPTKFQRRFMNFMKTVVFKEGAYPPGYHQGSLSSYYHHQQSQQSSQFHTHHGTTLAAPTVTANGGGSIRGNQQTGKSVFHSSSSGFQSDATSPITTTNPIDSRSSAVSTGSRPTSSTHFSGSQQRQHHVEVTPKMSNSKLSGSASGNRFATQQQLDNSASSAYNSGESSANNTMNDSISTIPAETNHTTTSHFSRPSTLGHHQAQYQTNVGHTTPRTNRPLSDQVDFEANSTTLSTSTPRSNKTSGGGSVSSQRAIRTASTMMPALAKQESLTHFNSELEDGYNESFQPPRIGSRSQITSVGSNRHSDVAPIVSYESSV
ncbi:phosphatidylinositol 4-phosphate 5-kinase type-1 alpha-like isoform X2 [Convolutriloba macropyga]|uniref:phosphatidylinositol 4-phosphate 5-kinase type-1 alpha-like isoform X2 n=1 Tax=Convolutriloba macropyga TaxID=536237 RepID=UPI003F526684